MFPRRKESRSAHATRPQRLCISHEGPSGQMKVKFYDRHVYNARMCEEPQNQRWSGFLEPSSVQAGRSGPGVIALLC